MKDNDRKPNDKKYIKRSILLNPIVIIIYGIACHHIIILAEYGGLRRRLPIILLMLGLLVAWLILFFFRKDKIQRKFDVLKAKDVINTVSKPWFYIALILLILITGNTGVNLYNSAQPYHGRLSWVIRDIISNRNVSFEKNNIYTDGVYGFLEDMNDRLDLPEELYLNDLFSIYFDKDGTITGISGSIYGFNENDERETFRIDFDEEDSENMTVSLDTGLYGGRPDHIDDVRLETLFDALSNLSLQEIVSQWPNEDSFELYYSGMRDFGSNNEGIIYYNQDEVLGTPEPIQHNIEGYTVSIYPPENEAIIPNRFVYTEFESLEQLNEQAKADEPLYPIEDETIVNESVAYQLVIIDAALGSRFYGLTKTESDTPDAEVLINSDPFMGETGTASGIHFINESLGFIGLSHNGGIEADLFRTEDGGLTFEKVEIPPQEVPLNENEDYNPFDFPQMPYEEGGHLLLIVGQGVDGDYNGGSQALYVSDDDGRTWDYVEEITE